MNPKSANPSHQPETEFHGELQEFSGPALAPDDLSLEPRERKGRPGHVKQSSASDQTDPQAPE